ncbi:MAG: ArsB/NhaD family transporter [Alphaproteobacteria bacterium]|nr:ArsB/NhaD family transporter [Alphaproteobacteria bacterium]
MHQAGAFEPHVIFGLSPLWVSTIVLIAVYGVIMSDRLNRAIVALLGAGLLIVIGPLDQIEAIKGVDFNTIALLTGMMILVGITRQCGVFQAVAIWSVRQARAEPWGILLMLQITTAVVSALLDNVTTVLLIVPVTLAITRELEVPPYPFLFAEVFASNIGGTATLIGDPPNILIGSMVGLTFNDFVIHLTPVIIVVMAAQAVMIHFMWGRSMRTTPEHQARVLAMKESDAITDWTLLKQSSAVVAIVILAFVFAKPLHLEPGSIAMLGAAVLMMLENYTHHAEKQTENVVRTFNEVEWVTIFFFVGLFMVVHGVEVAGLLNWLADLLLKATGGDLKITTLSILWASAVLSAIIDNIPFVATMIPLIKAMAPAFGGEQGLMPLWWALSLGACLGGNGTLVGASANLTVAGLAERAGVRFSFLEYTKTAFPLMLVSVAISHAYVWWRYL